MLASSNDHIKIELPSLRITWNLAEQKSYNKEYAEATSKLLGEAETCNRELKIRRAILAAEVPSEE